MVLTLTSIASCPVFLKTHLLSKIPDYAIFHKFSVDNSHLNAMRHTRTQINVYRYNIHASSSSSSTTVGSMPVGV